MGWLDKYEDGGKFDGLTNKGFNYNGAWGGQFQGGGLIGNFANNYLSTNPVTALPMYLGKKFMSNIAENIDPFGYDDPTERIMEGGIKGKKSKDRILTERQAIDKSLPSYRRDISREKIDLLQMLANKPQKYNSIEKSNYRPSTSKDPNTIYHKSPAASERVRELLNNPELAEERKLLLKSKRAPNPIMMAPLGNVRLGHGKDKEGDYISYYDKWDLNPIPKSGIDWVDKSVDAVVTGIPNALGLTTTPEIYDRIYVDSKTGLPIDKKRSVGGLHGQYQDGGYIPGEWFDEEVREREPSMLDAPINQEFADSMRGMMKSKIGMGNAFEHPAIKRMSQAMPKTGMTPEGMGTHYMSSHDHHAIPLLQDVGEEELKYFENPEPSEEDIYFQDPKEAEYFGEHYKEVAPMSTIYKGLQQYQTGGNMSGSVGFSYARIGAPSNGPYAKKTLPSAQFGNNEMSKALTARETLNLGKISKLPMTVRKDTLQQKKALAANKEVRERDAYNKTIQKQGGIGQENEQGFWSKAMDIATHPMTAAGYLARNQDIPDRFTYGEQNPLDMAIDVINPISKYKGIYDAGAGAVKGDLTNVALMGLGKIKPLAKATPAVQWAADKAAGYAIEQGKQYYRKHAEDGGIIDDDMGQWAHPGEITRINSNNITMEGVDQPLLGISDTGDKKLMQPGKNYKFKGKKVTEYPLSKNGKELIKLDQLTNFTNYNTKQPGGWLDDLK